MTEQKRHPRVQVSPMSIIVAVAVDLEEPPQQVEMLGQRASSQTAIGEEGGEDCISMCNGYDGLELANQYVTPSHANHL